MGGWRCVLEDDGAREKPDAVDEQEEILHRLQKYGLLDKSLR
jgi:hypothetical protein